MKLRTALLMVIGLILVTATVPAAAAETVDVVTETPDRTWVPGEDPGPAAPGSHTDKDAECQTVVPLLGSDTCTDTWDQSAGEFVADWHSTFHDLWTFGHLTLTVEDAAGKIVFQRDCQWLGVTGICIVQIRDGTPGTWTMRLDARVDATVGASSTAHGWFDLQPA